MGDDAALAEQVARLAAEPMNRSRPLWEAYLIHGLSGDRVALLIKLHHAAVDGVSGGEILITLLDESPHGREIPPAPARPPDSTPNRLGMLVRGLANVPRQQLAAVGAARPALAHLDKVATIRSLPGVPEIAGLVGRFSPGSRPESAASPAMVAPRTARVLANYPVSTIVDGMALNITLFSYLDTLQIGVTADPDLVPDVDLLAQALVNELDLQVSCSSFSSGARPTGHHRSPRHRQLMA